MDFPLLRALLIFFIICDGGLLLSCRKGHDSKDQLLSKIRTFQAYTEALDACKSLPVDSLILCSQNKINIDTVKFINREIWLKYGRAKALFHNNLGLEAIDVINETLPETENQNLLFERAELLELRSILFTNSYRMQLAAEDGYQAANIYSQLGLLRKASASYTRIASLQFNVGNYGLTVEIGKQAIALFDDILSFDYGDSVQLMHLYNNLALGYIKQNSIDSAEKYYGLSYSMADLLHDKFWKGLVTGNMADIYLSKGMIKKAIENYKYDIETSLKYNEYTSAALSLMGIGEIYTSNNQLDSGKFYYDSAYVMLLNAGRPISLSKYHRLMSEWYGKKNDSNNAFSHFRKYVQLRDSVQSIEINSQLQRIQNQKQVEKQLADINLLKTENELKRKELVISRISIVAFVIILVLLLVLLYVIRKNYKALHELNFELENKVRARTDKLRKINQELDTYLYRASHDVRRPILTILGLVNVANLAKENERLSIRETIRKTAFEMDKMLKKLQMAYELEKEKRKNKMTFNFNGYVSDKIMEISKEYPHMTFELSESDNVVVTSNINLVEIIFSNILENACIFSFDGEGLVTITVVQEKENALIVIRDQGIGIDTAFIEKIFEPYERFSNKSIGSGLGLYLALKAAKKIGGNIAVTSTLNEGSVFSVTFPIS